MSNLKTKEIDDEGKKFGVPKFWYRSSVVNLAEARDYAEAEMPEDFLFDGCYPFKVLYADNTISDALDEGKLPVAIVLSPRYALKLVKPEDFKKIRCSYDKAMALVKEDVLGYKSTAGSRKFWEIMVAMNARELFRLRQQMKHLGCVPLGEQCWINEELNSDYAWRASFGDKALATCRKCYFNEVWSIIEI